LGDPARAIADSARAAVDYATAEFPVIGPLPTHADGTVAGRSQPVEV